MESVLLTTADGHELAGDVAFPTAGSDVLGGVVICHPHPQYGGDRHHPVVTAMFDHLPSVGFAALRFDFRAAFGDGIDERHDVVAALDALGERVEAPLHLAGYSFGAAVALSTSDERAHGIVAVAPPLAMMRVDPPGVPVLLLVPEHDQFTQPGAASASTVAWDDCEVRTIESVDHFLLGRSAEVARAAGDWLAAQR